MLFLRVFPPCLCKAKTSRRSTGDQEISLLIKWLVITSTPIHREESKLMRLGSERNLFRPFNRILNIDSVLINSSLLRVSNSLSFIKFIARNILYILEESEKKVEGSFKLPCNFVITRGEESEETEI